MPMGTRITAILTIIIITPIYNPHDKLILSSPEPSICKKVKGGEREGKRGRMGQEREGRRGERGWMILTSIRCL